MKSCYKKVFAGLEAPHFSEEFEKAVAARPACAWQALLTDLKFIAQDDNGSNFVRKHPATRSKSEQ